MSFDHLVRLFRVQHWTLPMLVTTFLAYPRMDFLMALILPIVFCQQAFLFASNDYFDREIDAKDPDKKDRNIISSGVLSLGRARLVLAILVAVPAILSSLIGSIPFAVNAAWLVLAALYTAPPVRFKKRVGFDLLVHGVTVLSFPFVFAMVASNSYTTRNIAISAILVLISVFAQLLQEFRDYRTDSLIERNSVIAMGLETGSVALTATLVAALALSSYLVLTHKVSALFSIVSALCLCWIYDVLRTWRSGDLTRVNANTFGHILRKTAVCLVPVVFFWVFT